MFQPKSEDGKDDAKATDKGPAKPAPQKPQALPLKPSGELKRAS